VVDTGPKRGAVVVALATQAAAHHEGYLPLSGEPPEALCGRRLRIGTVLQCCHSIPQRQLAAQLLLGLLAWLEFSCSGLVGRSCQSHHRHRRSQMHHLECNIEDPKGQNESFVSQYIV
jgi:hypothetical protein